MIVTPLPTASAAAREPEISTSSNPSQKAGDDVVTFTHFQQTYGPSLNKARSDVSSARTILAAEEVLESTLLVEDNSSSSKSWLFWELVWYVPFILLQTLFAGTVHILRSLVLGHALGWMLQQISAQTSPRITTGSLLSGSSLWEQLDMFLQKVDMTTPAWAPPGLVILIVFTITALVVHPDGLTWVILRNLRAAMVAVFRASCVCWSMVVQEHGAIISTILALATFAALFFFTYALHKTLTPRSPSSSSKHSANHGPHHAASSNSSNNNKSLSSKKKKRKGNHGRGGGHRSGRTKPSQQQRKHEETSEVKTATHDSAPPQAVLSLPAVQEDSPVMASPPLENSESFAESSSCVGDGVVEPVKLQGQMMTSRDRTMSNCTVDTISTVDTSGDQSVGSMSDRSVSVSTATAAEPSPSLSSSVLPVLSPEATVTPLHPTKSSKTTKPSRQAAVPAPRKNPNHHNHHRRRGGGGRKGKDHHRCSKENNNHSNNSHPKVNHSSAHLSSSTPSRWDALKPENRTELSNNHRRPPVYHSPRTTNHSSSPAGTNNTARPSSTTNNHNSRSPMPHHSAAAAAVAPKRAVPPPPSPSTLLLGSCENGVSQWKPDVVSGKNKGGYNTNNNNSEAAATTGPGSSPFGLLNNSSGALPQQPAAEPSSNLMWMGVKDLRSLPPPPGLAPVSPPLASCLPPAASPPPPMPSLANPSLPYYSSSSAPVSSSNSSSIPTIAEPPVRRCVIKANPFETDDRDNGMNHHHHDNDNPDHHHHHHRSWEEDQIEADLKELGGRMVGSILDF